MAIREALALLDVLYSQRIQVDPDCKKAVQANKGGIAASQGAIAHWLRLRLLVLVSLGMNLEPQIPRLTN